MASIASALLNVKALYGDAAVAAITVANKVYMLVRNVLWVSDRDISPLQVIITAGIAPGSANLWTACLWATIVCAVCAVSIFAFDTQIMTWFRNDGEAAPHRYTRFAVFLL